MNINKIAANIQNASVVNKSSKDCSKMATSFLIKATEDAFESLRPKTKLQKQVLKMADEVWRDMKMPESIKPQIVFRTMFPKEMGGTDFSSCKMYLPNEDGKLLMDMIITKGPKATLAHELRHTKQLYSIAQLIGADDFEKTALEKRGIVLDTGWFEYVVKELGRISPNSKEGKYAQKCLDAYINYPKLKKFEKPLPQIIKQVRYKNNFLEQDARQFEKRYRNISLRKLIFG